MVQGEMEEVEEGEEDRDRVPVAQGEEEGVVKEEAENVAEVQPEGEKLEVMLPVPEPHWDPVTEGVDEREGEGEVEEQNRVVVVAEGQGVVVMVGEKVGVRVGDRDTVGVREGDRDPLGETEG